MIFGLMSAAQVGTLPTLTGTIAGPHPPNTIVFGVRIEPEARPDLSAEPGENAAAMRDRWPTRAVGTDK
jgi:hypothetical protein